MSFKEIKAMGETLTFKKGDVAEGILKEIREDVGTNKSNIYVIDEKQYWGASALDILMGNIKTGSRVRITCIDDAFKFPNGRVGRNFRVEVDE